MKQNPTTLANLSNNSLLALALSGNRDAQRLFEGKYGNPERPAEGEYDEEKGLDNRDRAEDMNRAVRL